MKSPYPKTERQLMTLMRKHIEGPVTPALARRFCAYVEALTNCDANSTRDWVDLFVHGFPGFKTSKHVSDWLDSYQDADDEDFDDFVDLIKTFGA